MKSRKQPAKKRANCQAHSAWRLFIISEHSCEAYWLYSTIFNNPNWQGYHGYGFIGGGFVIGTIKEIILSHKHPKAYKVISIVIEQTVIASVIIGYLQDFVSETNIPWAITADAGLLLFAGVGTFWHLKLKQRLHTEYIRDSKKYIALANGINFFYNGLLGAGILYYVQGLADSFNYTLSPSITYGTQAVAGLVYAGFNAFTADPDSFHRPYGKHPGKLIYALFQLLSNMFEGVFDFTYIVFQILMDSFAAYQASKGKKDYVSSNEFVVSITVALAVFLISNVYYFQACKNDIEFPNEESDEEAPGPTAPLLINDSQAKNSHAAEDDKDEDQSYEISSQSKDVENNQKLKLGSVDNCCAFWSKFRARPPSNASSVIINTETKSLFPHFRKP